MKKILGIIAIFLSVIILGGYFFRNTFIEYFGEKIGSEKYGAKIDIDNIDLNLFNGNLKVGRIQITDKNNTMRNIGDIKNINLKIKYKPLLQNLIVVDNATIGLVEILTPRKTDGFIKGNPSNNRSNIQNIKIEKSEKLDLNSLNLDIDGNNYEKILNNLNIKIVKEYNTEIEKVEKIHNYWNEKLNNIKYRSQLKDIEAKYKIIEKKIKSEKNPLKLINEVDELNNLIKDVKILVEEINDDKKQFNKDMEVINEIQKKTFKYINTDDPFKEIVGWNKIELQSKINDYLNNYLNEYVDKNIDFFSILNKQDKVSDEKTLDFWIKNTDLKVNYSNYTFKGKVEDFTSKKGISPNPIKFNLEADDTTIKGDLHGELNRETDISKIKLDLSGVTIDDSIIGNNKNLIIMVGSKINLSYNMNYENKIIDIDGKIALDDLKIDPNKLDIDLSIKDIIGKNLKTIDKLIIDYNYDGSKEKLTFNTNIETIFSSLIKNILDENKNIYKAKAKLMIDEKIKIYTKELELEIEKIDEFKKIIEENSKELKSLENKIKLNKDFKNKENLFDGLGDGLKNLF